MKVILMLCNTDLDCHGNTVFDTGQSEADRKERRHWTSLAPESFIGKYCVLVS